MSTGCLADVRCLSPSFTLESGAETADGFSVRATRWKLPPATTTTTTTVAASVKVSQSRAASERTNHLAASDNGAGTVFVADPLCTHTV